MKLGDDVRVKGTDKIGSIKKISNLPNPLYTVLINSKRESYYEEQLELYEFIEEPKQIDSKTMRAYLTALKINNPDASTLYSLDSAHIDFIPYQFRPVLKFIKSDRPRLLIADSVGVGKTIEAGLIIKEFEARHRDTCKSIIIICPRPLIAEHKWQNEMKRFNEDFEEMDGATFRAALDEAIANGGNWPDKYSRVIVPYSIFNQDIVDKLDQNQTFNPHFDLMIVDEVHNIRNPETQKNKVISKLADKTEGIIFLSATPIQLGQNDLFELLKILRPDLYLDINSFKIFAEPNKYINKAASILRKNADNCQQNALDELKHIEESEGGKVLVCCNEDFHNVKKMLERQLSDEERVSVISKIESLYTFNNIINRTRRIDIGNFTIRNATPIKVKFSESQNEIYKAIIYTKEELLRAEHGNSANLSFMMTTIFRQVSSCVFGMIPLLRQMKSLSLQRMDSINETVVCDDEITENQLKETSNLYNKYEDKFDRLIALAEKLDNVEDPKFDALLAAIEGIRNEENFRVMIFSTFKATLSYLKKRLQDAGYRVGLINGDVKDEDRRELRRRFKLNKGDKDYDKNSIQIMLFSEVGCEGLDYQFCHCMVNYDLPWNPMKIEQRIGRIDRNGQESEMVNIINLITVGTIDETIYERCFERIGVFRESIGDCEEILGEEIEKELSKLFSQELTQEQINQRAQTALDNKYREIEAIRQVQDQQDILLGIQLSNEKMEKEVEDSRNIYVSPENLKNLVIQYMSDEKINGRFIREKNVIKLSEDDKKRRESKIKLSEDYISIGQKRNPANAAWHEWLINNDRKGFRFMELKSGESYDDCSNVYLSLEHPLVIQAAKTFDDFGLPFVSLKSKDDVPFDKGSYNFKLYLWTKDGISTDRVFKCIAENEEVENYIEKNIMSLIDGLESDVVSDLENINNLHRRKWEIAEKEFKEKIKQSIDYKKSSLKNNYDYQMNFFDEQIRTVEDPNIRGMRNSQKQKLETEYKANLDALNKVSEDATIKIKEVLIGKLTVE